MKSIGIICQHRSGHTAYEQWLSNKLKMPLYKELDLNTNDQNLDKWFSKLPTDIIFSCMVRPNLIENILKKYKNINWRILYRKDVYTQCLSFIYTNKTQKFREDQNAIVDVDIKLIDYFFKNWQIINKVKATNLYPVYYYEDVIVSENLKELNVEKNNNDYVKLIKNIDMVNKKIKEYWDK